MRHITKRSAVGFTLGVATTLALATTFASAATDEQRGADLLAAIERGESDCSDLDGDDYAAIGEFAMGRMAGSVQAHAAMDELMAGMIGEAGLARMHEAMGQRFAGCGQAGSAAGLAPLMGMMGMMGGGVGGSPGMMGGGYGPAGSAAGRGYGPGSMMGFDRGVDGDDDAETWMVVTMLVLVGLVGIAVFLLARPRGRPGGRGSDPLDLLTERFARGEVSADDYRERRQLLEGGKS